MKKSDVKMIRENLSVLKRNAIVCTDTDVAFENIERILDNEDRS